MFPYRKPEQKPYTTHLSQLNYLPRVNNSIICNCVFKQFHTTLP